MRTMLRGKVTLLFMMLGMLLAVPAVAYAADEIITDGDLVTTDAQELSRNLGTLAPGATFTADPTASPPVPASDVNFYLDCNGQNHFNSNETADLNVRATSRKDANGNTPATGSVDATSLSNFSGPTSWPADMSGGSACNTFANALIGTSNVTIEAPKKAGSYTYTVTYTLNRDLGTATNELALDDAQVGSSTSVTVTFTFSVNNVAPTIDSFQVSNTDDGTSATEGQTKTYVISASDANEDSLTYGLTKDSGTANVNINPVENTPGSFTVEFLTPGTLVLKASASDGTATTTQNKTVTVAAANTAPTVPGAPTASSNPNKGVFNLNWAASDDDGKPNPPGAVTYTLQHKNSATGAVFEEVATGISGNSFSFTAASPEAQGTWTYRVQASDGSLSSDFSAASSAVKVDRTAPSAPTATTNPTSPFFSDWFKDTVTVSYSGSTDGDLPDGSAGSGVPSNGYSSDETFSSSGTHNYSGTATDAAGNVSAATTGSVKVDATNPVVNITGCPTTDVIQNSTKNIAVSASDAHSGLATDPSNSAFALNTGTIGQKTASFKAVDNVGHEKTESCTYNVIFNWNGFFSPIDNLDSDGHYVLNSVKAGSAVPVKFSLSGNQGLSIFMTGYPKSSVIPCDPTAEVDAIESTVTAGQSTLQYDASLDQYTYVWKTEKTWTGCRQLEVKLADGTSHRASFKLSK